MSVCVLPCLAHTHTQSYSLAERGDLESAYAHAKSAMLNAGEHNTALLACRLWSPINLPTESAFYDPSILALLYFPDDQK